jgi:hypothetical protein
MDIDKLVAIDMHTHAEVSCCQPPDLFRKAFEDTADKYWGLNHKPSKFPSPLVQHSVGCLLWGPIAIDVGV